MAVSTHSKIYYGLRVTVNSRYLDFKEGVNNRRAILTVGSYTGITLCNEIKKQMEAVGSFNYTVSFNRQTRVFTISSDDNFDLLCSTGISSATSVYPVIGFDTNTDKTGTNTYTADAASGKEYKTQLPFQNYKPTSQNKKAIDGVVQKSANGTVEVVKYGNERFMSCELMFITNVIQNSGSIIRSNKNGVNDFLDLMDWLTEKYVVEVMIDENNPQEFESFILESTEQDQKGLDFELIELYDRSLPEYFRSGMLKFRLME